MTAIMVLWSIFGIYITTSLICLFFPCILHKKKKVSFSVMHISHRGGAGENLENTIEAFKHAVDIGTDMLELDCHMTLDGKVVVSHDNDLFRLTGVTYQINQINYKNLPELEEFLPLDFDSTHMTTGDDRKIPLLETVFKIFPKLPINIDIKCDNDKLIQKVSELVIQYNREDFTVWGNKSSIITEKCFQKNPNIHLFFSMRRVIQVVIAFHFGLLPFLPIRENFFEVLMPSILLKKARFNKHFPCWYRLLFRLMDCLLMNRYLIKHLNDRGIQTLLWVLNTEDEYDRAFALGATGVMTDFPTLLRNYLDRKISMLPTETLIEEVIESFEQSKSSTGSQVSNWK